MADVPDAPAIGLGDAIDRAIACGDEHAIKWIEACDREQRASGRGLGDIALRAVRCLGG